MIGADGMTPNERYRRKNGVRPRSELNQRPFRLEPLLAIVRGRIDRDGMNVTHEQAAENRVLGISAGMRRRYLKTGLSVWRADQLATHLGFHPAEVFDTWFAECDGCTYQENLFDTA